MSEVAAPPELPYRATSFDFRKCILQTADGDLLDIRSMIMSFDLHEDLFAHSLRAVLFISDAQGLVERLPIVGGELVWLEFKTPGFDDIISQIFVVSGIPKRKGATNKQSEAYCLDLRTQDEINSLSIEVSRGLLGMNVSDAIRSVYSNFIEPHQLIKKELLVEKSYNLISYIAPSISPLPLIDRLADEAVSLKGRNDFVFYEDHERYNLTTLSGLLEQGAMESYFFSEFHLDKNPDDYDTEVVKPVEDHLRILSYEFNSSFDVGENVKNGLGIVREQVIDPITKRFTDTAVDYSEEFKDDVHLGNVIPIRKESTKGDGGHKRFIVSYIDNGEMYSEQIYLKGRVVAGTTAFDWQAAAPRMKHISFGKAAAARAALTNIVLNIAIPGNTARKAGDVVNIFIPQITDVDSEKMHFNKLFGTDFQAKFLVTRVTHHYDGKTGVYITHMICAKDAYETITRDYVMKVPTQ